MSEHPAKEGKMKVNLTKLLNIYKNYYIGIYGETGWVGNLLKDMTSEESPYMFELEEEDSK